MKVLLLAFFRQTVVFFCFIAVSLSVSANSLKEAKKAYSQKQFQKATKLFWENAKKNPGDGEAYMYLGYIAEFQKDYRQSIQYFRKAVDLKLSKEQRQTSLLKILIFYNYHQAWDYVLHYANRYLKIDPSNREVAKMRDRAAGNKGHDPGDMHVSVRQSDAKESKKSEAKEKKEKDHKKETASREKDRDHKKEKDKEHKKEHKKETASKEKDRENKKEHSSREKDKEHKKETASKEKDKEHKKEHLSKEKDKEHKKETASVKESKKKKKEEPEEKPVTEKKPKNKDEEKLWEKGLEYLDKEEFMLADRIFGNLVRKNPSNKNYLYKAGIAKLRLGEYEKSLSLFSDAAKNTESDDRMMLYYISLNEGQALQKLFRTDEALKKYLNAYRLVKSKPALTALMKIYYETGNFEESLRYSDKILQNEETNTEGRMHKAVSLLQLGSRKEGFRNLIQFSSLLKKEFPDISKAPVKYHEGILYLGVFYSGRNKYRLAMKYLKAAESSKIDSKSYIFAMGKIYHYTGKYDLSLSWLEKLPKVPAANYLMSRGYAQEKNAARTKEYFAKAAGLKEIYWVKVKLDSGFREMLAVQDFADFISNRGETPAKSLP
ncbi:MAG TPA: tetratricopeptide repeat protein [Leptospiraceae bacterium]|nr:tetratricopeptide repeat protein [Leptospiraceae bacterium]HNF12525.1 tetratricopeptide repeat protein [Leptospiraceae bacterium]HNM03807.1 tetratricopeptide repeat protein [Leptospiraceae bacterium]HNN04529.1 tetratricopeptide repeat protein [Leptospiraceae bacterium]